MIVTTLPLSPLLSRPFPALSTVVYADIISRCMNAKLLISLNMTGLRYQREANVCFDNKEYKKILQSVGISEKNKYFCDTDTEYYEFVKQKIQLLVSTGEMKEEILEISSCPCGVVEIGNLFLSSAHINQLSLIEKKNGAYFCKKCEKPLFTKKEEVWRYQIPKILNEIEIFGNKVSNFCQDSRSSDFRKIISRKNRRGVTIQIGGSSINLDVDFYWSFYLDYLTSIYDEQIVVIVASGNINELKQCVALVPKNRNHLIKSIVYPLLFIKDVEKISNRQISDFLLINENSQTIRAFFSLGLSWNQSPSVLTSTDLHISRLTASIFSENIPQNSEEFSFGSLFQCVSVLNRYTILKLLKNIRSGKNLNETESKVISSILNPS
ncbi:MAG: hypothetical protein NT098_05270 [Candidatus Parcubacteria bacterium]|nr:hypothetical protein [Candidatus Parcubacteria bacterium]